VASFLDVVAGNQVLAAKWAAFSYSGAFASLPVFDYVSGSTICNAAVSSQSSFSTSRHTVFSAASRH
jgi:hypothetical protein